MSASGALTTKARAMFGMRLKEAEYQKLLQQKTVSELAYSLKHDPAYSKVLDGINEKAIHRGQLETLLRRELFVRIEELMRYADETDLIKIAVINIEVSMILRMVRNLADGKVTSEERSSTINMLPMYMEKYIGFKIADFVNVSSMMDLEKVLVDTPYHDVISEYSKLDEFDYSNLEHDLFNVNNNIIHESISDGQNESRLTELWNVRVELDNICTIYRLKKYFKVSSERIKQLVVDKYALFNKKEINQIIDECSADEVVDKLKKKYHRYIGERKFNDIESYRTMIFYNYNHTILEYEEDPMLVMLAYVNLLQIEIDNLINIIEGVRYHVNPERIKTLLIY